MNTQTKINAFYNQCTDNNTNILTAEHLKSKLEEVKDFDWEEFNKPIHEMDVKKLADSLKDTDLGGNWKTQQSKTGKPSKAAIQTYTLDKSTVAGIGSGRNGSVFMIRGLKSKFTNHPFKFGGQEEQNLLSESIESIKAVRDEFQKSKERPEVADPRTVKKLCSFKVDFELCSGTEALQQQESLDQLKYLYLLQTVLANQVARQVCGGSPRDSKAQVNVKVEGCMQSKYDDFKQNDVLKASLLVDAIPLYTDNEACTLVQITDPDASYEEDQQLYNVMSPATINDWIRELRMRDMDILVVVDQCCVKKTGRDLTVMPRFKIKQAVVKTQSASSFNKKHIGLRLIRQ